MYIIITQKKIFFKKFVLNFTESVKQQKQNNKIYLPTGIYNKKNKIYFLIKINKNQVVESLMFTRLKNIFM